MRIPPPSVIATFPVSDPAHPTLRGPALVIVNTISMVLITIGVSLRIYTRASIKRQLGWDDYTIVVAFVFALSLNVNSIMANTHYGWNRHIWDLPFKLYGPASIFAVTGKLTFTLAATFTRMSLVFFYYRLIHDTHMPWFRRLLQISLFLNISLGATFIFMSVFLCHPVQAYWTFPTMANSTCLNEGTTTLATGIINSFADLETTLLPLPIIHRLHLPGKQRLAVLALLSLGFVVTTAGIVRTYFIWKSLVASYDETWYAFPLWISACVEIDLGVLCACAPALRALVAVCGDSVRGYISKGSTVGSPTSSGGRSVPDLPNHDVPSQPAKGRKKRTPSVSLLESRGSWWDPSSTSVAQDNAEAIELVDRASSVKGEVGVSVTEMEGNSIRYGAFSAVSAREL